MRKVHVITQKELVDERKLANCTAIVLDVFLATSTIVYALANGCREVIAVADATAGLAAADRCLDSYLLLGESKGNQIAGFHYPDPTGFDQNLKDKTVILCSTNGTVAINKAIRSRCLLISSLLNGHAVAKRVIHQEEKGSVVLICSGNDNRFSAEDFIGAGQVVHYLREYGGEGEYELSDAAELSLLSYQRARSKSYDVLHRSETSQLLTATGFRHTIRFVLDHEEAFDIAPSFHDGKIVSGALKL